MKASHLIQRFVFGSANSTVLTAAYRQAYAAHYAPGQTWASLPAEGFTPPAQGQALTQARTLLELAQGLDAQGIEVHQEGLLARFQAALTAPAFGRASGPMAGRAKTLAFYARVLELAVEGASARSFCIPAVAHQGAVVAVTEVGLAVQRFRAQIIVAQTAQAAVDSFGDFGDISDRPELAVAQARHEEARTKLVAVAAAQRGLVGRDVSMHTTALAEALGALTVAEGGPWFRQVTVDRTTGQLVGAPSPESLVVGVEVVGGSPLLAICHANLDPQHGGGTFGMGGVDISAAHAACDAALRIRQAGIVFPAGTRFVTDRMDPDSLVAAMILSGRIPMALVQAGASTIRDLARYDSSSPMSSGGWVAAAPRPQSVGDLPIWGAVAAVCLQMVRGLATLDDAEAAVFAALADFPERPDAYQAGIDGLQAAWRPEALAGLNKDFSIRDGIAVGRDMPIGGATWAVAYSIAPIGLLVAERFPFKGQAPGRKYTLAVSRDCGAAGVAFHERFRALVAPFEKGWAGPVTMTGSPFGGPSSLDLELVARLASQAARDVGILTASAAAPQFAMPSLR